MWRSPRSLVAVQAVIAVSLGLVACGEPPNKEIHQAQGAIEAARAAGAEAFASAEYQAAVEALDKAQEAVAQRDYRLALNHALDSRERAEAAARTAADEKARARAGAERAWQAAQQSLQAAKDALQAAARAKVSERQLRPARAKVGTIEQGLPALRARIDEGDIVAAGEELASLADQLDELRSEIDAATMARSSPRSPATRRR